MMEKLDIKERLLSKIKVDDNGCWLWTGFKGNSGYGNFEINNNKKDGRVTMKVHRLSYEIFKGPIPEGMLVCHTCDVRECCNPEHLWLGTQQQNIADMMAKGRHHNSNVTHCPRGHEYSIENTYIRSNGNRICRTCKNRKR
jgi:hypothetical protein